LPGFVEQRPAEVAEGYEALPGGIASKEQAQGIGYGSEMVAAAMALAARTLAATSFEYPVAVENRRRIRTASVRKPADKRKDVRNARPR
jgi:RimJ/RimL family protein N-acetyltransferase